MHPRELRDPTAPMMCEACLAGDHANCGMQTWCRCEDLRDGNHESLPDMTEWDEYEEDGPMDLEDSLDNALDRAFGPDERQQ
jgi:hypothetical protein